jgi:hypothetical protein
MQTLGRTEYISIPAFNLSRIEAKIDTGAYSCAICSKNARLVAINGSVMLRFGIYSSGNKGKIQYFMTSDYKTTMVKSSNGITEKRFVINAGLKLGKRTYKAALTLSNRRDLRYAVLIGRKLLRSRFLVDVSKNHALTEN